MVISAARRGSPLLRNSSDATDQSPTFSTDNGERRVCRNRFHRNASTKRSFGTHAPIDIKPHTERRKGQRDVTTCARRMTPIGDQILFQWAHACFFRDGKHRHFPNNRRVPLQSLCCFGGCVLLASLSPHLFRPLRLSSGQLLGVHGPTRGSREDLGLFPLA